MVYHIALNILPVLGQIQNNKLNIIYMVPYVHYIIA